MSTSNKDFKIKNGLIVQGTTATVNGENILTSGSNIDDLSNVNTANVADGNALVYDTDTGSWIPGEASGGASVTVNDTPPALPDNGDLWLDSTTAILYIWYVDNDGGQWVAVQPVVDSPYSNVSETPPADPVSGSLWVDSSDGALYVYYEDVDGGQWIAVQTGASVTSAAVAETPPSQPAIGDFWVDSSTGILYIWYVDTDGGQWIAVKTAVSGTGGASIEIADTAPASPEVGNLWFDSTSGAMYVYYDDGDTSQWVAVKATTTSPHPASKLFQSDTAPSAENATENDFWFNTTTGNLYVWYVSNSVGQWISVQTDVTVAISSGIDELADVVIDTPANNETIVYNSSLEQWENKSFVEAGFYTSPNYIINGAFDINQRGLTSTGVTAPGTYGFDRWYIDTGGGTIYSAQTFTPGTAPTPVGIEGTSFARLVTTGQSGTSAYGLLVQKIEDVRILAGRAVTVSFWAKSGSGTPSISIEIQRSYGTGGSAGETAVAVAKTILTGGATWTRYTANLTIPSLVGKTVGQNSFLALNMWVSAGTDFNTRTNSLGIQNNTFDIWGVQLEEGSVATPFRRNANSIQGELAACQRYYWRSSTNTGAIALATGIAETTSVAYMNAQFVVPMRVPPTSVEYLDLKIGDYVTMVSTFTSLVLYGTARNTTSTWLQIMGATGLTATRTQFLTTATVSAYIAFNAEL